MKGPLVFCSLMLGSMLLFVSPGVTEPNASPEIKPLKVGVIAPLSGSAALYGNAVRNGLELALSELKTDKIKVIYEDDRFISSSTVAAFEKLTNIDKVDLVLSIASAPSKAVAPLADRKHVVLLAWASDQTVGEGRQYVIRSYMSGRQEGEAIAKEALRRKWDKVAEIITINDYPISVYDGFVETFPREKVVLSEKYPPDANDYKPFLTKLKARGAQAIMMCLNPGQLGILGKQVKKLGLKVQLGGCMNLYSTDEVRASEGGLVGAFFAALFVSDEFRSKYMAKFHNDDVIDGAATHYDIAYLLNDLMQKPDYKQNLLGALLQSGPRHGALGDFAVTSTATGDHYFKSKLVIKRITENGFEMVGDT